MRRAITIILLLISTACAEPPARPQIVERYNGDVVPQPARTENLVTDTYAYWAALEGGRWHQAWRYHTLEFQKEIGFERWLEAVRAETFDARRPSRIRWSKGAHRYQGPELYALMDWVGPGNRSGQIAWREVVPGTFRIERADPF